MRTGIGISARRLLATVFAVAALPCLQATAGEATTAGVAAADPFDAPVADEILSGARGSRLSGVTPDYGSIQVGSVLWDDMKHPLPPKPPQPRQRDGTFRTSVSVTFR